MHINGPLLLSIVKWYSIATGVDMLVKTIHWSSMKIKLKLNSQLKRKTNRSAVFKKHHCFINVDCWYTVIVSNTVLISIIHAYEFKKQMALSINAQGEEMRNARDKHRVCITKYRKIGTRRWIGILTFVRERFQSPWEQLKPNY